MAPYLHFIFKDRYNKRYLFFSVAAILLQFLVFKWLYPFGDYFTDSYTYISSAANHDRISYRPLGYSWFLRGVHVITASESALLYLQYLLVELGALHLFFTLLYFYRPGKYTRVALFILLLFNPALLYISNFVSSDAIFIGASLWWFTLLLWTLDRPRLYQLLLHALWLFIIIQTRFAALYYPLVAVFAILIAPSSGIAPLFRAGERNNKTLLGFNPIFLYKPVGILLLAGTMLFCIRQVQKATLKATGTKVFSAFSGWQLANNALHVYCDVAPDTTGMPSSDCRTLDSFVHRYFDTACPQLRKRPPVVSTDYMWVENMPLKQYLQYYMTRKKLDYFDAWNAVGPIYSAYGGWLIKKHPFVFARCYLWPNAKNYLQPGLELMTLYNQGMDTVDLAAQHWFHYAPGGRVHCASKTLQQKLLAPFPALFLLCNVLFVLSVVAFLLARGFRRAAPGFARAVGLAAFFFVVNAGFSIFATPASLRYEMFAMILLACFTVVITGWLWRNRR